MKKKNKQAKDHLINSLLEDLKESSSDDGVVIGPDGVESSGLFSRSDESSSSSVSNADEEATAHGRKKISKTIGQIAIGGEGGSYTSTAEDLNDKTTLLTGSGTQSEAPSETQFLQISSSKVQPPAPPTRPQPAEPKAEKVIPEEKPELTEFQHSKASYHRFNESKVAARELAQELQQKAPVQRFVPPAREFPSAAVENKFLRVENARIAQERINELEHEVERYRKENEMLSSSHEVTKSKIEELLVKNMQLEKQRNDFRESSESELKIFREALMAKDSDIQKLKAKVDELSSRLNADLRKIRVRERELENRLEMAKVERTALMRAKDETILELKRKQEVLDSEIESYQRKILDLNEKIELNQEQFARTVRALRLALTNLEVNEETTTVVPLARVKKAE